MGVPVAYRSALYLALIDALETHYRDVGVTIDWDDYSAAPDPGQSSGFVLIDRLSEDQGVSLGPRTINYSISLNLSSAFVLGSDTLADAYDLVDYAYDFLIGSVRANGLSGTYRGRTISKALTGLEPLGRPLTLPNVKQDLLVGYQSSFQFTWTRYSHI